MSQTLENCIEQQNYLIVCENVFLAGILKLCEISGKVNSKKSKIDSKN